MLEEIKERMTVKKLVLLTDTRERPTTALPSAAEYEELLASSSPAYQFPDFDDNARATTFCTTGTIGLPQGVYFSHRQLVLHTLAAMCALGTAVGQGFHRTDVYMPITRMFHVQASGIPYIATVMGIKQVHPGRPTCACAATYAYPTPAGPGGPDHGASIRHVFM